MASFIKFILACFTQIDIRMILIEVTHIGKVFESTMGELNHIMTKNG